MRLTKSLLGVTLSSLMLLNACSTNPATGDNQFTLFMPASQEKEIGASEHKNILKTFGGTIGNKTVENYVTGIGQKMVRKTERNDVTYSFYVLDSDVVNAFALPGGYVYVTRGLLALANSEAELAAVIGHEIGHVTARHSAERYSQGVLASLGTGILGASLKNQELQNLAGVGANLYLSGYSRSQEHEADELGLRYLHNNGYDLGAMADFLSSLNAYTQFEKQKAGVKENQMMQYFATHPQTADRVSTVLSQAQGYSRNQSVSGRDTYLSMIDGLTFGESEKQGFIRGRNFYHKPLNFTFSVPKGFTMQNQPTRVVASSKTGGIIVFDSSNVKQNIDPATYVSSVWMKGEKLQSVETININGKKAATTSFTGTINGQRSQIRLVAIKWDNNRFYRYILGIPTNASADLIDEFKRTTYSLRPLTLDEMNTIKPYRIDIVTAQTGDSVKSLSKRQVLDEYSEEIFRIYNGLSPAENVRSGNKYKIITQ